MRVVLLDPPGFTPPYDHSLAAALARRGHEVHLLAPPRLYEGAGEPNGYRRHDVFVPVSSRLTRHVPGAPVRALLKGLEYPTSVWRALRRLEGLAPDVVHVQWLPIVSFDVRWLRSLAREHPTVLTAHDLAPRRRLNLRGWEAALATVDRVVVHSEKGVEQLAAIGIPRARLAQIAHPVFAARPGHTLAEPSGHTLLFFGLLRTYKGLDVLVDALPQIAEAVPDVRLVVAGRPLDTVRPLQELATSVGVEDRIEWRLGHVPESEVPPLFDQAAVVVLPYRQLDSSGVLATALGYGRPAVVSDVGSLGAIVRGYAAGRAVPPGDLGALADACVALLTDRDALAAAARGARAACEGLTWDASGAKHEQLYEAVLAERS